MRRGTGTHSNNRRRHFDPAYPHRILLDEEERKKVEEARLRAEEAAFKKANPPPSVHAMHTRR